MSVFSWIKGWRLDKVIHSVRLHADKVAISITETVKHMLDNGSLKFLADVVAAIVPSSKGLSEAVINQLNKSIPQILAAELAVQGLPDNPTEEDVLSFEKRVLDAFGVHDNKSKLYTTLSAQVYGIIKSDVDADKKLTFAELVEDVEEAYKDYLADKEDPDTDNTL